MEKPDPSDDEARRDWSALSLGLPYAGSECPDANSIAEFTSNTLPQEQRAQLESHLENCGVCRDAIRELQAVMVEPLLAVPEQVLVRARGLQLRYKPVQQPLQYAWSARKRTAAAWVAAAVVMLTGGGLGYSMGTRSVIDPYQTAMVNMSAMFSAIAGPARPAGGSADDASSRGGAR